MKKEAKLVRIQSWREFKRIAKTLHPSSVSYSIQRSPLSKPPVGLRIIFADEEAQYVFLDFARGDKLWRTKIPGKVHRIGGSLGE